MTDKAQVTAPDTGQGMPHGNFSGLDALAALKPHVRVYGETLQEVEDTSAPSKIVDEVVEVERTPEEDATLFAEIKALMAAMPLVISDRIARDAVVSFPRVTSPKAPEGVSRDIGALFGSNVPLGKYWFYVVNGEKKCGTATLKVVRSRAGLDVLVVAVEGDVPGYLRDLRMGGRSIELAALIDPESFGDDEMSLKAKQLGRELARIRNRMARARSRNRRNGNTTKQETQ